LVFNKDMKSILIALSLLCLTACKTVYVVEQGERAPRATSSTVTVPKAPTTPIPSLIHGGTPIEIPMLKSERRPAKVYLPVQYANEKEWPLVVLLHGFSGSADSENHYLTMSARVSSRGFILVTPEGMVTPKNTLTPEGNDLGGNQFWNATDFCCDFAKTGVDDVLYLRSLIASLQTRYKVNPKKIYVIGHSNGGFMANRLACEMGEEIAAIANLAGGSFKDLQHCRQPVAIPYLQIHAANDPTVKFENVPEYAGGKETVNQWLNRNGCNKLDARTGITHDYLFLAPGKDVAVTTWPTCSSRKPVVQWLIKSFEAEGHNPHVPLFNLNFSDAVLNFLFKH